MKVLLIKPTSTSFKVIEHSKQKLHTEHPGRPACALVTHFTNELWVHDRYIPSCLTAYEVCKALNADASARVHPI